MPRFQSVHPTPSCASTPCPIEAATLSTSKNPKTRMFRLSRNFFALTLVCAAAAIGASAQTFKPLVDFKGPNGATPYDALVQGPDGNLYGTTSDGGVGSNPSGTVFKMTPAGKLTTLYTFCALANCADGSRPTAALTLGADGNFYGTTWDGGTGDPTLCGTGPNEGCGTVFKITPQGQFTSLYSFCSLAGCADGKLPFAGLAQATDGNFYGVTQFGGTMGFGTAFKLTPQGLLTTLYSFCSLTGCSDGAFPSAALVQGTDGNLYGTTAGYGNSTTIVGTIFKLTTAGSLTTLYSFCVLASCADGHEPGGLVQGTDGNFYGSTNLGGANSVCRDGAGCGTIFKITPAGNLTTLYNFCALTGCADGSAPLGTLIQATDGDFYGTTSQNGGNGEGTIFKLASGAALTTLHSFSAPYYPGAGLVQATNGSFYGTTDYQPPSTYFGYIYTLGPAVSMTALTTSGSPSIVGQPVTFTATVTSKSVAIPNGGLVTFSDGSTVLGSVALSGGNASYTTSSLSAKTHDIKAAYAGATWIAPSSRGLTQVVEAFRTTTTLTSSPNPSTAGQAVVLTATVTSAAPGGPTGNVTFRNGATTLGTKALISGSAALTTTKLPAGTLTLSATYDGDTESAKSSGTTTQTVQ